MPSHELDTLSLVAGLLYLAVGAAVLIGHLPGVFLPWRIVGPGLLILVGVGGVLASSRRIDGRRIDGRRIDSRRIDAADEPATLTQLPE